MEYRKLSGSGLSVPALSFGTATFGGGNEFFKAWGSTDVKEASRLVDICLEHGANFFDTANGYSKGMSEEILGAVIKGRRQDLLLATKATFPMGDGPNDYSSSRYSIIKECEASLKRLGVDHIDMYYMHGFDALTPVDETLRALDDLVRAGKIRYIGCSNFSGWQLMKSLSTSEKYGWSKYVAHQVYYSLVGREYEWELMPLAIDQKVSAIVWSPMAGGALSGKITRNNPPQMGTRSAAMDFVVSSKSEHLFNIVDVLKEISEETGKTIPQVALNWVLQRPTIASIIVGARNEEQLIQNFGAIGWKLSKEQIAKLDTASDLKPIYPYWHQNQFPMLGHPIIK
jgi:aryl-alcohol dehydrogenase-like predicted oxidoreductase